MASEKEYLFLVGGIQRSHVGLGFLCELLRAFYHVGAKLLYERCHLGRLDTVLGRHVDQRKAT